MLIHVPLIPGILMSRKTVLGTRGKWRMMPAKEHNTGYSERESSTSSVSSSVSSHS